MTRSRPFLGSPVTLDGLYLAAILDVLDHIAAMLDDRLPGPARPDGGPVEVREPAPTRRPAGGRSAAEPGPRRRTGDDDEDRSTPVAEPAPKKPPAAAGGADLPPPPPRVGRGASAGAWRAWASRANVAVAEDASRDDIIAACQQAGVLSA